MSQFVLFARGVIALLALWPALSIAVREQWGGPDSAEKQVWMASVLVDEFESRADYLAALDGAERTVDPASASDPPLDHEQLADLLAQIMSDEFEASIEDDSVAPLASDILRLWRDIVAPGSGFSSGSAAPTPSASAFATASASAPAALPSLLARTPEETVAALERQAAARGKVVATSGGGPDEVDGDSDWSSDDDDDGGEPTPASAAAPTQAGDGMDVDEAPELVLRDDVDEDGFTVVRKGRRR
ncbi:rRNA accumulation-related protein [Cryptotrichosporon argae]